MPSCTRCFIFGISSAVFSDPMNYRRDTVQICIHSVCIWIMWAEHTHSYTEASNNRTESYTVRITDSRVQALWKQTGRDCYRADPAEETAWKLDLNENVILHLWYWSFLLSYAQRAHRWRQAAGNSPGCLFVTKVATSATPCASPALINQSALIPVTPFFFLRWIYSL